MVKTIPLHDDDLLFLDVLPELHPDFIEKIRKSRQMFPQTISQNNGNATKQK